MSVTSAMVLIFLLNLEVNGTKVETATETFPGKERRAAIKRFEELKKERPGIDYIKDIEKKSWER